MEKEQFDEFLENCILDLEYKQEHLIDRYNLNENNTYWYNGATNTLQFLKDREVTHEFQVIPIGSFSTISNIFYFVWANDSFPDWVRKSSSKIKELFEITKIPIFDLEGFDCDEQMSQEIVALCVDHLSAVGMYKIPTENSTLYLAITHRID